MSSHMDMKRHRVVRRIQTARDARELEDCWDEALEVQARKDVVERAEAIGDTRALNDRLPGFSRAQTSVSGRFWGAQSVSEQFPEQVACPSYEHLEEPH